MSFKNMPNVKESFQMIRDFLKGAATTTCEVIDTPEHYELTTVDKEGQKHLFAYVVAHQHVVTLGFNTQISDNDFHQLVSQRLRAMMNDHRRLEIRDAHVDDLRKDIQDAFQKILYFYSEKNWITNA